MNRIFSHAPAETEIGSLAYLQAVQRAFPEDGLSGLIEITPDPTTRIDILYADGAHLATYQQAGPAYTEFASADVRSLWPSGEADLRILRLPRPAVFAAHMLIEWHPPVQTVVLQSSALQRWIDELGKDRASGLVAIEWPEAEGVLPIINGVPLVAESIFTSSTETQVGSAAHRLIFNQAAHTITLALYKARPETATFQMLALRQSVQDLTRGILSRYTQLVGRGLTSALVSDLNHVMRHNAVQIQVVGELLNNTHIFHSLDDASAIYRLLFRALYEHTANVLGTGLAHTIITDTLSGLNLFNQNVMDQHSILSGVALR